MVTIELDETSRAFYQGVAAGADAQERMAADGWKPGKDGQPIKARRAIYWFFVGDWHGHLELTAEQTSAFLQGAAVRQP